MLSELMGRVETSDNSNKDIENIKTEIENKQTEKNQSEMKNTLTEMQNTLQGINSRVDEAENQIRDLMDKETENTQTAERKQHKKKSRV